MFFLLISKIIPPTSIVVPLISKYLLFTFIMNILSVLNTCLTINLYYKHFKVDHLPKSIQFLVTNLLPRVLFMKKRKKNTKIKNSLLNDIDHEKKCLKSMSTEFRINSPIIQKNSKCHFQTTNNVTNKFQKDDFKKFSSHHDLVLSSKENEGKNHKNFLNTINNKSNFNTKKRTNELNNFDYYAKKWASFENNYDGKKSQSTKSIYRDICSLDNIKLTDRFLHVCKSVDYIANLIRVRAELEEVI